MTEGLLPEWSKVDAVMMAWPHEDTDWAPWLAAIQADYAEFAVAISAAATPLILCRDAEHRQQVEAILGERCERPPLLVETDYNDTWCRDYGPLAVIRDGVLTLLDFRFNGWGDKFDASLDNGVNGRLGHLWQAPLVSVDFELEGGSIETDGNGSLMSTHHCLLDSNRNHDFDDAGIEAFVLEQFGQERMLWISEGMLLGDDTDSHIDNLVRFCSADTIAYATCRDRDDIHFEPLQKMEAQVQALRRPDGSRFRLVPVDIPPAQLDEQGCRLPASYVNFLIVNDRVLVPVFGCATDARAMNALQEAFPDRQLVPVPGHNLIRQFGGPHCATMQLPAGTLNR